MIAHPGTIRSLQVRPLDIPLFEPFGISGGAQAMARNLLVRLELADGTIGYGEAAPFPAFNGETQTSAFEAIMAARPLIEGADVRAWRPLAAALREQIGAAGSARCAIETAMLDALTRQAGIPLYVFFGGVATAIETDMTITTGGVAQAAEAAQAILARGISTIKVKIGGGDPELDLHRIVAIQRVAPEAPLILDGNGGMDADAALALLTALAERQIRPALIEQPVPGADWAGLARIARSGLGPVAADESATSAADVLKLACNGTVQVVNIKLMKCGVVEALDIAAIARAAGLGLMIGGMVESILAMSMSAHVAAGLGGFSFVDLDTPMFLAENPFVGGFAQEGARLELGAITAGHGVTPISDTW